MIEAYHVYFLNLNKFMFEITSSLKIAILNIQQRLYFLIFRILLQLNKFYVIVLTPSVPNIYISVRGFELCFYDIHLLLIQISLLTE